MRLEGKRILVADDEPRLTQLLKTCLGEHGAIVDTASDGQSAFRSAAMHEPDLIVMDLNMPNVNGLEAIRSIRITYTDKPILVLTGYNTDETVAAALDAGASACMAKPPVLEELVGKVCELVGRGAEADGTDES